MTELLRPTEPNPPGTDRYLEPHQARTSRPTSFENELGDAIENAYAAGIHDLDGLVAYLATNGPAPEAGGSWTAGRFTELMKELGA